jgi:hypothetical protein
MKDTTKKYAIMTPADYNRCMGDWDVNGDPTDWMGVRALQQTWPSVSVLYPDLRIIEQVRDGSCCRYRMLSSLSEI